MVKNDVGHDDETVKTTNCQLQRKFEAHESKKCNLCHPSPSPSTSNDIFDDYYFCDKCLSQL
jgi:hypothetical protein